MLRSLFSMFLSRTVKRPAGLMYGRRSITYIVPQDNQWVCGSPQRARQRQIDGPLLRPYVPRDTSPDSLQIGRRRKGCSWIKADTPQGCSTHNCHLCGMNSRPKWRQTIDPRSNIRCLVSLPGEKETAGKKFLNLNIDPRRRKSRVPETWEGSTCNRDPGSTGEPLHGKIKS